MASDSLLLASSVDRPAAAKQRPRFSLRFLLLAVSVFGVAFPMWYVWPYTDRELFYPIDAAGKQDKTKPPRGESIRQMKRVIAGQPVRHGLSITRFTDYEEGLFEFKQEFVHGVEHGMYREQRGELRKLEGQYEHGKKSGLWVRTNPDFISREQWQAGQRHGTTRVEYPDGNVMELSYAGGILTHRNSEPISAPILEKLRNEQIGSGPSLQALADYTQLDFQNTPIVDVVSYLNDFHQTQIQIDPAVIAATGSTGAPVITDSLRGIDLATALCLITDDVGLVCDYRNDSAWITLPDENSTDDAIKK